MKTSLPQQAPKKPLFTLCMLLFLYCLLELSSLAGLAVLKKYRHIEYQPILTASLSSDHQKTLQELISGKTTYLLHSPELGWTIKPNGYWQDLYRANSQGIRADRDYQPLPRNNAVRIATFGDSFTHGEEVKNGDTWEEQLNRLDHNLEVINFGVGGYGLDQAFLRYQKDGARYHPQLVFIGFMEENINRLVNVFRPFYTPGIPLTKPRFMIQDNQLLLLPNPMGDLDDGKKLLHDPKRCLAEFGAHDFHYAAGLKAGPLDFSPSVRMLKLLYHQITSRYSEKADRGIYKNGGLNTASEAFSLCIMLFDAFYRDVQKNNALPIIVLFPNRADIERYRQNKTKVYTPLITYMRSQGYRVIDLCDAFEEYAKSSRVDELFLDYHYSPRGNSIVAQFLFDYLAENRFITPAGVTAAIASSRSELPRAEPKKP
jgi:hypothetical protein